MKGMDVTDWTDFFQALPGERKKEIDATFDEKTGISDEELDEIIDLTGKYVRRFVRSGVDSWCEQVAEEDSDVPDNIKIRVKLAAIWISRLFTVLVTGIQFPVFFGDDMDISVQDFQAGIKDVDERLERVKCCLSKFADFVFLFAFFRFLVLNISQPYVLMF